MLKRFTLKNYRNFKDTVSINFEDIAGYQFSTDCIEDGVIRKMLIYGRNATGKTNLGEAFMDIYFIMFGRPKNVDIGVFLHADSAEETAEFSYVFQFNDKELLYHYARFSDYSLQSEKLEINGNIIFACDHTDKKYNFENLYYIDAETANTERYLQSLDAGEDAEETAEPKLPFLRWLISNVALKSDSALRLLENYVNRMTVITAGNSIGLRVKVIKDQFYQVLEKQDKLQDLEDFLNAMGVECKLALKKLPDGQSELYFAHKKLVPFYENASSGTLALVHLYRRIVSKAWKPSFVYLDEFDAFYHYEMAENVIKFFKKKYPKCQMIMTSHNTNLMTNRLMRPDCLFILSRAGTLTALCNATPRELREGHNLEKMYISGEFEKYE